jgi:hypothetical protein
MVVRPLGCCGNVLWQRVVVGRSAGGEAGAAFTTHSTAGVAGALAQIAQYAGLLAQAAGARALLHRRNSSK